MRSLLLSLVPLTLAACHHHNGTQHSDAGANDLSVGVSDDGVPLDLAPSVCSGPGTSPDSWFTFGHDAQRTSMSNGCIHGHFTELWRYGGYGDGGTNAIFNAVADDSGVYAHVSAGEVPSIHHLSSTDGSKVWAHTGSADYEVGNWPTVALGKIMILDDGLYILDAADGTLSKSAGVDWWGQNTADADRFYVVTSTHGDGPGAFVGAWDLAKGSLAWKANQQGGCTPPVGDENGGLAVEAGVVYFAPRYETGDASFGVSDGGTFTVPSGVYAFDAAAGTMKWSVGSDPFSAISVGNGNVYLIEDNATLVARKTTDGSVAWMQPLGAQVGRQAPVIASGRVIVSTMDHVTAFDAATGAMAWSVPVMGAMSPGYDSVINFLSCKSGGEPVAQPVITKLAAASASNTLVAAGSDGLHTLSLADGSELDVSTAYANASNPIIVGDRVFLVAQSVSVGSQLVALQSK